jgi:sulfide:quinone oxidoreductase
MAIQRIAVSDNFSVSSQVELADVEALAADGVRSLICNRPDGEGSDQPTVRELRDEAARVGIEVVYLPVVSGKISRTDVADFSAALAKLPSPVHAFCRTGTRSLSLWSLDQRNKGTDRATLLARASELGYDLTQALADDTVKATATADGTRDHFDVVIVGGGAAGIAVASSLMARTQDLSIAIVDPAEVHYYQPGWTMVGGGIFRQEDTVKTMASLIPPGVRWIRAAVGEFEPDNNRVLLEDRHPLHYDRLIVAPGLKLDWHGVEGLVETLGRNGVTSNYRFDLAPYTWQLVSSLRRGRAVFTQPPMPIKCAGAPQKAMYLSGDHWRRSGVLKDIDIAFYNAGAVLFGVKEYVPALMEYVELYGAALNFGHRLTRVDGEARTACFEVKDEDGKATEVSTNFDMIHVCPPQTAPDFVRQSPLADDAGWVDVDQNTLQHKRYSNIWSLGDAMNAPNAKTAAAARMQAPVVAMNLLHDVGRAGGVSHYNGYGSCPLTVERGKIVLAEFGYGGKLLPSFPRWLINGQRPSRMAWVLKEKILPPIYWKAMLRGREWMARPESSSSESP